MGFCQFTIVCLFLSIYVKQNKAATIPENPSYTVLEFEKTSSNVKVP